MTEKEILPAESLEPLFDPDLLSTHLLTDAEPRLHSAFGEGYHFALGSNAPEHPDAELEFYPDTKIVRFVSGNVEVTMKGDTTGEYTERGLVFSTDNQQGIQDLFVNRSGEIFLMSNNRTNLDLIRPLEADSPADSEQSQSETKEKQEKVTLEGRAGRDAQLRETKNGKKITKFPLAVHELDENGQSTIWHTIVTFNELAVKTADEVKKGLVYKVVGYLHEKTDDNNKVTREIYAVNVRPPKATQQPASTEVSTETA